MKADFSRISFDPALQFSAVLHQQGRVITDADLNEQSDIGKHFLESLAASLTGSEGAIWLDQVNIERKESRILPVEPRHLPGFCIKHRSSLKEWRNSFRERASLLTGQDKEAMEAEADYLKEFEKADWWISPGHYYAGGLRCENDAWVPLSAQPFLPDARPQAPDAESASDWLVYLDAWERPLSWLDRPRLSDIALGAAVDTAMRSQIVWQVRTLPFPDLDKPRGDRDGGDREAEAVRKSAEAALRQLPWQRRLPRLRVRIAPGLHSHDPCRPAFATAWPGQENLLYRVEIHDGSPPPNTTPGSENPEKPVTDRADSPGREEDGGKYATSAGPRPVSFKWSRENGSVAAKVSGLKGDGVTLFPGQLRAGGFRKGDRVELVKNEEELSGVPGQMFIVDKVQGDCLTCEPNEAGAKLAELAKPCDKLRRWDQKPCGGTVMAVEHQWVELEHGIEVLFEPAAGEPLHDVEDEDHAPDAACLAGADFRSGDYWVFTARTATAAVDWPLECPDEAVIPVGVSARLTGIRLIPAFQLASVPVRTTGLPPAPAADAGPAALPPHGVRHRYAVLALALHNEREGWHTEDRRRILHLCEESLAAEKPLEPKEPAVPPVDEPKRPVILSRSPSSLILERFVPETGKSKAISEAVVKIEAAEIVRREKFTKLIEARTKKQGGTPPVPGKTEDDAPKTHAGTTTKKTPKKPRKSGSARVVKP